MKYLLNRASKEKVLSALLKLDRNKTWDIDVTVHAEHRSTEQNKRLWALHTLASEVTGYTPAEMHELALSRFFGSRQLSVGLAFIWLPKQRSSTKDAKQFTEFMTSTEEWYISELGVWLE